MPFHAAQSGSAVGGAIEGFLSGFQSGTELRGRRADRRRLADLDASEAERQRRLDAIDAEDRGLRLRGDREDRATRSSRIISVPASGIGEREVCDAQTPPNAVLGHPWRRYNLTFGEPFR